MAQLGPWSATTPRVEAAMLARLVKLGRLGVQDVRALISVSPTDARVLQDLAEDPATQANIESMLSYRREVASCFEKLVGKRTRQQAAPSTPHR